jgi:hypothetical protein
LVQPQTAGEEWKQSESDDLPWGLKKPESGLCAHAQDLCYKCKWTRLHGLLPA